MRTTITIDDRIVRRLRDEMRARGTSFRKTLESVLEQGLDSRPQSPGHGRFRVEARAMGLRAGIDPSRLQDLDTELEVDRFIEVTRKSKASE